MKKKIYRFDFDVKVYYLGNGYEYKTLKIEEEGFNKQNAMFNVMKRIDLDLLKDVFENRKIVCYELMTYIMEEKVKANPQKA